MDTQDGSNLAKDPDANPAEDTEKLQVALEEATKKASDNWDLFLRARADCENVQRRATLDVENAHKYGMEKFARELLLVVDSLDQGLVAAENSSDAGLKEGMKLTQKLLLDTLDKFAIKVIDPIDQPFDPAQHEALSTQPSDGEPNRVLVVFQKGFTLQERILRPARVIVSRAADPGD